MRSSPFENNKITGLVVAMDTNNMNQQQLGADSDAPRRRSNREIKKSSKFSDDNFDFNNVKSPRKRQLDHSPSKSFDYSDRFTQLCRCCLAQHIHAFTVGTVDRHHDWLDNTLRFTHGVAGNFDSVSAVSHRRSAAARQASVDGKGVGRSPVGHGRSAACRRRRQAAAATVEQQDERQIAADGSVVGKPRPINVDTIVVG